MIEILVSGNVDNDFKRLGVNPKLTYGNDDTEYKVYEITEEDLLILSDEPDIENTWINCGWRYCIGSNQGTPNDTRKVNNKDLICWNEGKDPFGGAIFEDLLHYLFMELGATTFKNVCALTVDLAKYNNLKLSELFRQYQGE